MVRRLRPRFLPSLGQVLPRLGRILPRLGQAIVVLLAAFTASFLLLQALPADAILIKFMNPDLGLSPEQIAEIHASYGADTPLWSQYLHALGNFLTGDFGVSVQAGVPVRDSLAANLPATLTLASLGFLAAAALALAVAFLATVSGFGWLRNALGALPGLFVSVPVFWLGILLIQVFSFQLRLVPVVNPGPWERLILPVAALAVPISAPLAQVLLRNIDAVLTQPFVAVARAKGASRLQVLWRHVVPNALLPTLTIAGVLFGELLAGAVVTEAVFGLNGLGTLTQQAVANQDAAVLQAVVVISAAAFVAINLAVDLLYPLLDPRLAAGAR
jgi:peptide/nickel transport system permease protein